MILIAIISFIMGAIVMLGLLSLNGMNAYTRTSEKNISLETANNELSENIRKLSDENYDLKIQNENLEFACKINTLIARKNFIPRDKAEKELKDFVNEESDYEDKLEIIRQLAEESYDLQKRVDYLLDVKKALLDSFKLIHEENQINKMISRVALRNYTDMYDEVKDLKAWKQVALGEFHSGGIKFIKTVGGYYGQHY